MYGRINLALNSRIAATSGLKWSWGRRAASFKAIGQKELLPEGLAGDMEREFEFSGKEEWMQRDVSLVVTGWIDSFKNAGKRGKNVMVTGDGTGPHMNIYRYGANVMSDVVDSRLGVEAFSGKLDLIASDGLGGSPDRVMLVGERGSGKSVVLNQAVLHARKMDGYVCLYQMVLITAMGAFMFSQHLGKAVSLTTH